MRKFFEVEKSSQKVILLITSQEFYKVPSGEVLFFRRAIHYLMKIQKFLRRARHRAGTPTAQRVGKTPTILSLLIENTTKIFQRFLIIKIRVQKYRLHFNNAVKLNVFVKLSRYKFMLKNVYSESFLIRRSVQLCGCVVARAGAAKVG